MDIFNLPPPPSQYSQLLNTCSQRPYTRNLWLRTFAHMLCTKNNFTPSHTKPGGPKLVTHALLHNMIRILLFAHNVMLIAYTIFSILFCANLSHNWLPHCLFYIAYSSQVFHVIHFFHYVEHLPHEMLQQLVQPRPTKWFTTPS